MRIVSIQLHVHSPHSQDVVEIVDLYGNVYTVTAEQLKLLLIEDEQMCEDCEGELEITTMERVYPGEPHMAPVGTTRCTNPIHEPEPEKV